jgi:hypothetical protein
MRRIVAVFRTPALVLCVLIVSVTVLWADWIENGIPVCTESGEQTETMIVSDGAGGAIIAWEDTRDFRRDIYAQRIDPTGTALWTEGGVPVCIYVWNSDFIRMASDGFGGAILTWIDDRNGDNDVYAQRIDSTGMRLWAADGAAVCTATEFWARPVVAPDGSGGAFIAWEDDRGDPGQEDIYAQRIDASGSVQWATDGIAICSADQNQGSPEIVSDGVGGAIIAWYDDRYDSDIFAQRVDSNGVSLWDEDGIAVHLDGEFNSYIEIACDGAEGAIISWARSSIDAYDIYAQRVDSTGVLKWTSGSVCVSAAPERQWFNQDIICDGAEGAIITWYESRDETYWNIYAQRIDSSGVVRWAPLGVDICTELGNQIDPKITPDGAGGGIITWQDSRDGSAIYAQRVDSTGSVQWEIDGVPVCLAIDSQNKPKIVSDGAGWGAIVAWEDRRSGELDIYAQYVSGPPHPDYSTVEPWDTHGGALVVPGTGTFPDSLTVTVRDELGAPVRHAEVEIDLSSCTGLCIDSPDGLSETADVYGTALLDPRAGGCCECDVLVLANGVEIRSYPWVKSPDWDGVWANGRVDLRDIQNIYDMWGTSDDCADLNSDGFVDLDDLAIMASCKDTSNAVTCPDYLCGVAPATIDFDTVMTGTEHDTSFTISNLGGYPFAGIISESCSQLGIISGGGVYTLESGESRVVTIQYSPVDTGYYACTIETGDDLCTDVSITAYAIDTIPPPVPTGFDVAYNTGSGNQLQWNSSEAGDLEYFNVYRSGDPDVQVPEPLDTTCAVVYSTPDTFWTDDSPDPWQYRYRLTAVDHVSNESDPAYPETVTGDEKPRLPGKFTLYQNIPNPFNPVTTLRFDIPRRTTARLAVYDVNGRLVRVLLDGPVEPGRQSVTWDGRNGRGIPVASGIYFYRLATPEFSEARKMILLR